MVNQDNMAFLRALSIDLEMKRIRLPSFPDAVIRIREAMEQEDCDIRRIAELASLEPMLATRLLQAANSAFYNASGISITEVNAAVMRLGLKEVRNMAIALAVEQAFIAGEHPGLKKDLETLWRRSIALSSVAHVLAAECSKVSPEQAFLCGLLHDVGKLYMLTKAAEFPGASVDLAAGSDAPDSWHPQIGRCIVEDWGFDGAIADSLQPTEHIEDNGAVPPELVDVVYVAEMIANASDDQPVDFEHVSARKLGLTEAVLEELEPKIAARRDEMLSSLSR